MNRWPSSRGTPRSVPTAARTLAGVLLAAALAVTVGGQAVAVPPPPPNPSDAEIDAADNQVNAQLGVVGDLINQVADATNQLQQLDADVARKREDVNKALVDLQNARDDADDAAAAVTQSRGALDTATQQIADAQQTFDSYVTMSYTQGNVGAASVASYLASSTPEEVLDRAQVVELVNQSRTQVLDDLQRARTEQANRDSAARQAKNVADDAAADALAKKDSAEEAIQTAEDAFTAQTARKSEIESMRDAALAQLESARANVAGLNAQRDAAQTAAAQDAAQNAAIPDVGAQDVAGPVVQVSASTDPNVLTRLAAMPIAGNDSAIAAALQTAKQLAMGAMERLASNQGQRDQATELGTGRRSHTDVEDSGTSNYQSGSRRSRTAPNVTGSAAVETVVDRAMSQLGVPYAWGGGDANGPTRGIRDGGVADSYGDYKKIGFDCSGLMLYAFAGVGIDLEHYSGYQYTAGKQVPVSQMRRGDMLFWGANGGEHVALYLGDGMMIEAPQSGEYVQVSEVREAGMAPYATRLIT